MALATFEIWRGNTSGGKVESYTTETSEGMVVLDAVRQIQAEHANDLAVRWNCKAGKCGSCSAEINGMPKLMCMTRLSDLDLNKPVYARTSAYGHFGRPADKDGGFSWEKTDLAAKIKAAV